MEIVLFSTRFLRLLQLTRLLPLWFWRFIKFYLRLTYTAKWTNKKSRQCTRKSSSHWCYCLGINVFHLWPYKHYQRNTNEHRRQTLLNAMPTCLRACSDGPCAHIISSSLDPIWLECPDGWEKLHPADGRPLTAVTHSAWSLQELAMRPAKSYFFLLLCKGKAST